MSERLSSADVSFFYLEGRTTPQHVGGLAVFAPLANGFDYDRLVRLLEERISLVPRYRQKLRPIPGHLAHPVWVDDPNFDITYHVRRSALPSPGTEAQLLEFCARILSRPLDRARPLWEMYLLEGLADGQVAIVTKTHHSMLDGLGSIDIAQVILDSSPEPRRTVEALWMPEPEPSAKELVLDALTRAACRPAAVFDALRLGIGHARVSNRRQVPALGHAVSTAVALLRPASPTPLKAKIGLQRRIAVARTRLEDYQQVRTIRGATVNDVVLATVAGALRGWLLQRGQALAPALTVRALVQGSVSDSEQTGANRVAARRVTLPVGEASPLRRLELIGGASAEHKGSGRRGNADILVTLSGFAPPTLHAVGARAAHRLARRMFSLAVTDVPGPQQPLYAAGARMTQMFPILPLGTGQAVSIGLTSYDGGVFYGVNGDRDAMPDVALLATLLEESLAELVEASRAGPAPHAVAGEDGRVGRRRPAARRPGARTPRGRGR